MPSVASLGIPDLVVPASASVGEGPVFDRRTGALCWVDLMAGRLHETDLDSGVTSTVTIGMALGAVAPRRVGAGFAVAVADGFGFVDAGGLRLVDRVLPGPGHRMNDAKCDSRGRLWAGSTHVDFASGAGALHRWDGRGPSVVVARGFTLPNGIGWSPDDTRMYLVDSMSGDILAADFDAVDGVVGEFRVLCRVGAGLPDGLAVDVDGCIWVAVWGGSVVQRYSPDGVLLGECRLPVSQPSSCAFAADGTLVITSARAGLTGSDLSAQPLAGSIFAVATSTRGVPVEAFLE